MNAPNEAGAPSVSESVAATEPPTVPSTGTSRVSSALVDASSPPSPRYRALIWCDPPPNAGTGNVATPSTNETGAPQTVVLLLSLGVVPSYYLRYFYAHDEVVREQLSAPRGRPLRLSDSTGEFPALGPNGPRSSSGIWLGPAELSFERPSLPPPARWMTTVLG